MGFQFVANNANRLICVSLLLLVNSLFIEASTIDKRGQGIPDSPETFSAGRQRLSLNTGWRFMRAFTNIDNLLYDSRPDTWADRNTSKVLKPWILPSANDFINDPANHHERPAGNPGSDVPFVQTTFDDKSWEDVTLPHDYAIKGPFYTGDTPIVDGGMGRLPVQGIAWYRRKIAISHADKGKQIYLDVDGAMSYAMVWLNGHLVGGWPYPYNSFRLDLTPYLKEGNDNQLAIRLDNPNKSARWYPGGGLYRNIWLTKVDTTHVAQWGTQLTSRNVSSKSAALDLVVQIENKGVASQQVHVGTDVHILDATTGQIGLKVAEFTPANVKVPAGQKIPWTGSVTVKSPQLWGPPPTQHPHMYVAVTSLTVGGKKVDSYETRFGIRTVVFDGNDGLLINGERIRIQGTNQHHDLGALGAGFNVRAAERHLEILQDVGSNAIRMSHNPPAPELLELADRMGFVIMDEIFDCWYASKTDNDFHLIFEDWHEADLRSVLRRDRNHPSVIIWSIGNEVGEQYTDVAGAAVAKELHDIVHEEDSTRLATASMNYAKSDMPFPTELDVISLNYQGEGIRDTPAYAGLSGITTPPQYEPYHAKFPEKTILETESASTLSTRGTYFFPVTNYTSAPQNDTDKGSSDNVTMQVSAYELYTAPFGSSPDKVFLAQDTHPYVAGEFIWSGWDYIGEPTPYYTARSSYYGIIDLAGFKKDRYYLYQARWRPDLRFAHILPHWTWPDRVGKVTPIHVFTSADEAELLVNGKSQGKQTKDASTFRFRWDDVVYQPGEVSVVTYKGGKLWAKSSVRTVGNAAKLKLTADRSTINSEGSDLSFISVEVLDKNGDFVAFADNEITFSVSGAGEIVATDNGDPYSFVAFPSKVRKAYNGLALAIVRPKNGASGPIVVTAKGKGLSTARATILVRP